MEDSLIVAAIRMSTITHFIGLIVLYISTAVSISQT